MPEAGRYLWRYSIPWMSPGTLEYLMTRIATDPFDAVPEVMARITSPGLLLTCGTEGNPITIGWGSVGIIWGKPIFTVLVRPSRYSFGLLRRLGDFCVNVPAENDAAMKSAVAWCGSHSGRDGDKASDCGITKEAGIVIDVPHIRECPVHFECRSVHANHVLDAEIDDGIRNRFYPKGDLHQIWWGEILGCWRVA